MSGTERFRWWFNTDAKRERDRERIRVRHENDPKLWGIDDWRKAIDEAMEATREDR